MTKHFSIPFAAGGDKSSTPNAIQPDGSVSYTEGFTSDYALPNTDPDYKPIPRAGWNGLMFEVTEAIAEIQKRGVLSWRNDVDYTAGASVIGSDGMYYKASQASGPSTTPRDPTSSPSFWDGPSDIRRPPVTVDVVADIASEDCDIGTIIMTKGGGSVADDGRSVWLVVAGGTGTPDGVNYIDMLNGNQAFNLRISTDNAQHNGELLAPIVDDLIPNINIRRGWSLSKINVTRAACPWGMTAPINNLGDSISHGAFAGDLYYNGWTRILSRMLSSDFGGLSYQGFVPMLTLGSGPTLSRDIHSIAFTGTWNAQDSATTVNGKAAYNGLSFQTVTQNDAIKTTIPTFQERCRVWYLTQPGGGELTISDNTGVLTVINTDGPLAVASYLVALVDDRQGSAFVEAKKTDATAAPVDVIGFGYIESVTTPVLHNFSTSGRRLRYVDEQVIEDCATNASVFMLSLGHNDQADVDANPVGAYALAFTQRIDWVIQYCNANGTFLVVNDFCWTAPDTSFARSELKRAAKETGGVYIPFPNLIRTDGVVPSSAYLTSTVNMWVDASHPNVAGNKWIAETIAKFMGLSITSKKGAIAENDYWMPFAIPAGTENSFTSPQSVSAYRINGEELNYRYSVQKAAGGSFPVGTHSLQTAFRVTPPFSTVGTSLIIPAVIRNDTNIITSSLTLGLAGAVDLKVNDGTWINDQAGVAKLPIKLN